MDEKTPQPSEALQQSRLKAARLANAFQSTFGQKDRRSAAQELVFEHLAACAGDEGNSYKFGGSGDGVAQIAAGIHRDGARSLLRVIERQLSHAEDLKVAKPKPPVTVKR